MSPDITPSILVPKLAVRTCTIAVPETAQLRAGANARLRSAFLSTLAANVLYAGCQWGMLVVLAKQCSSAEVGAFALGVAVTAPVIQFSNLQLRSVQATDAKGNFALGEYVHLRAWATLAAIAVIAAVAIFQRAGAVAGVVVVVGLSKSLESVSDVLFGYLQQCEQMNAIALSVAMKGVLAIGLMALATVMFRSALAAAAGVAAAAALMLVFYDGPVTRRFYACSKRSGKLAAPGPVRFGRLRQLATLALPLGIVQGLVSLSANIPRYQLERSAGLAELGIFSALASLIVVGQTVVSALGNVTSPRLARLYAAGDIGGYLRLLLTITAAGGALGLAGVGIAALFGRPILTLLFRPEYGERVDVLVIIMIGATLAYVAWFAGFGLTAAQLFREQIPQLGTVCLSAWLAAVILVPRFGVAGAAGAFAVSMAVQATGAALILWFTLRRRPEFSS